MEVERKDARARGLSLYPISSIKMIIVLLMGNCWPSPATRLKAGIQVVLNVFYNKGYLSVSQHFAEA